MTTRSKIVPLSDAVHRAAQLAASGESLALLIAWFDPLTGASSDTVTQLAAAGAKVIVLLTDPPDPILDRASRAQLAAALQDVVCVCPVSPDEVPAAGARFPAATVCDHRPDEARSRQNLIRHVHARQQSC